MSKERRSRQIEVRLSLLSFLGLLVCWALITAFAYYFGTVAGRMAHVRDGLERAARAERIAPAETGIPLSFPDLLSAADPRPETRSGKSGPEQTSGGRVEGSPSPERSVEDTAQIPPSGVEAENEKTAGTLVGSREEKVLQIGAFRDRHRAERLVLSLRNKGFSAYLVSSDSTSGQEATHRVLVGPFLDPAEAMRVKERLENQEALERVLVLKKPASGDSPP